MKHQRPSLCAAYLLALLCFAVNTAAAQPGPNPAPGAAPAANSSTPTALGTPSATDELPPPPPPPSAAPPTAATSPTATSPTTDVPPAPPAYAEADRCMPACRSGYLCQKGQCVSACNPSCAVGETCNAVGECVVNGATKPVPASESSGTLEGSAQRHDGFFLRLVVGLAGAGGTRDTGVPALGKLQWGGGAGYMGAAVGIAATGNLILHVGLSYLSMPNPKLKLGSATLSSDKGSPLSLLLASVGTSYYIMPLNMYLGASIGLAGAQYTATGLVDRTASKAGLGLELDAGKEWWINELCGMGVALRLTYASVPSGTETWHSSAAVSGAGTAAVPASALQITALSVLFSVTYN